MALFKNNYNKPGPGVPKNAPKKKGVRRFAEIFARDFFGLLKLNIIYQLFIAPAQIMLVLTLVSAGAPNGQMLIFAVLGLLFCIPLGGASTAFYFCITKMLRDEPGFLWHDFKRIFKENFKNALIPGIIFGALVGAQLLGFSYYILGAAEGVANLIFAALYIFALLLFAMATPYFFTQSAYVSMKTSDRLKNSLVMSLGFAPKSALGAVLGTGLLVAQLLLFPLSLIVMVLIGYSIPTLLNLMWVWPIIDKIFKIDETLKNREKGVALDAAQVTQSAAGAQDAAEREEPASP